MCLSCVMNEILSVGHPDRLCYGVGICQCGLQGRADCTTGTVGEGATGQHTGAGQHPHQVRNLYLGCFSQAVVQWVQLEEKDGECVLICCGFQNLRAC